MTTNTTINPTTTNQTTFMTFIQAMQFRDQFPINSADFAAADQNLKTIINQLLAAGNKKMAIQLADEICDIIEILNSPCDPKSQHYFISAIAENMALLITYGFHSYLPSSRV